MRDFWFYLSEILKFAVYVAVYLFDYIHYLGKSLQIIFLINWLLVSAFWKMKGSQLLRAQSDVFKEGGANILLRCSQHWKLTL